LNKDHNNSHDTFVASIGDMYESISISIENGGQFSMITAGTSMMPLLRNRKDTVVLTKQSEKLKLFDIPLYKRKNGQFVLHRVLKIDENTYSMCGDNQLTLERGITDSDVVAVVSKIVRNGKEIDLNNSWSYSLYVFLWCRCFFLRFAVLKVRALLVRIYKLIFSRRNK